MTVAWCVGTGGVAGAKTWQKGAVTCYSHVTMTQAMLDFFCYIVQYTVCPQGGVRILAEVRIRSHVTTLNLKAAAQSNSTSKPGVSKQTRPG